MNRLGYAHEVVGKEANVGEVSLPNGDIKMDLMDLTLQDLSDWNDLQGEDISIDIGAFAPSKGNIIYFVSKGSKPQLASN